MAFFDELPVVGGVFGSIFGDPEEDAHQAAMKKAVQDMYKYRPEAMNARMTAMGNMSHAFNPMNNMMGQTYGPGAQMDMSKMIQNPFSPEAIARMNQQAGKTPAGGQPQYSPLGQLKNPQYNENDAERSPGVMG